MIATRKDPAMRVVNSLLGVGHSLLGCVEFPAYGPGKIPQVPFHNRENRLIPVPERNIPCRQGIHRRRGARGRHGFRQAPCPESYLILASRKTTCLRATGSNFFSSSLFRFVRGFFFVT